MKHLYATCGGILLLSFLFILPQSINAQAPCSCASGVPDSVTQLVTLPPTTGAGGTVTFNKLPLATGILTCLRLDDTLSVVATVGIRNVDSFSAHAPQVKLSLNSTISGPALSMSNPRDIYYGPDSLSVYLTPGDTLTYGPDTVYNKVPGQKILSGAAASNYAGPGTVTLTYGLSGGAIPWTDGTNYNYSTRTTTWGTFRMTYYYCPNAVLATNIANFTVYKKDNDLVLNWLTQNAEDINFYTIEISTDGTAFRPVAQVAGNHRGSSKFTYDYRLPNTASGYIYIRVRQTDNQGKYAYTPVRTVALSSRIPVKVSTYPNPASSANGFTLSFDRLIKGNYNIQVVGAAGDIVFEKNISVNNTSTIPVEWSAKPAPGLYFARITSKADLQQQVVRLVVQ